MRPTAGCETCQCTFGPTPCFHWTGGLEGESFGLEPTVDEVTENNLVSCGPGGLGAWLPPYLMDPPAVSIYAGDVQSIKHDTPQYLFFPYEHFDTESMHAQDDDDGSSKIVFNTAGIYEVSLSIRWNKNSDGDRAIWIRKNDDDYLASDALHAGDADLFIAQTVSCMEPFEAGDYVKALVKQDCGIDLTVTSTRWSPVFAATFLRPLP